MAASTKLVLVVVALLIGVSILFYGVMFDDGEPLDVATPDSTSAVDDRSDPAAAERDTGSATASGAAGASGAFGAGRPSLARSAATNGNERPALGASRSADRNGSPPETAASPRQPLGAATGERPALSASARTGPGQIEMGAGRGALAGGTRLPESDAGNAGDAAANRSSSPARPLARPERLDAPAPERRPSLGDGVADGDAAASSPSASSTRPPSRPALGAGATAPSGERPAFAPADPARVLKITYSIRKGDTLSSIAARHLGDARHWPRILDENPGLDPARLAIGQRIVLPSVASVEATPGRRPGPTPAAGSNGERIHEVVPGDSLSSIASRYLGGEQHWRAIARRNRDLLGDDPDRLAVGMKLRIPARPDDE